ncbi:RNA polymerase sigma factor sigC isoform X4 [Magnolia sinica]|uniref:RNA polymerase sigma factor sigC isoform X4 n=1 Tax=Magnolia sinica TaxID=86752 RepID=UPI002659B2DE|nr:RNA polymerase sigma factor sigC isoform X4 [Magnolia sinica]
MGHGFMLDWKWAVSIQSSLLSSSSTRPHSSSLRGREASFELARASAVSVILEENEIRCKDSHMPYACSFGALQSFENVHAATKEIKMVIGKREDNTASCAMLSNANVPILEDASACLASLQADSTSHFGLLMENLEKIEEIFDDSDVVRLERDILIQIGRLGALKIFHACLSRTVKAPDAPQQAFPLTETSKNSPEDTPVYDHMNNITVRSRKKRERKSRRERVTEKAAKMSALSPSSKAIRDFQQLPTNPSNSRGRRHSIVRNESEMSRGVKEIANLEKVRMSLEERIGRAASLSRWAHAAGMDVKVLQQRLHFGRYCRDKLLKSTRSLVLYIARNYRGRGLGLEDLLQAGNMGVLQGAERFDHTRGYQFSTYVQYWVRKSMSALIARHSRGVRIPVTLNNVINKTQKARRAFYDHHGRYPQDEEIAKLTGTSLTNVRLANKCSRVMGSTDQKVGDCIGVKFMEITPDTLVKTPEETVMSQHMRREIHELLIGLHPRERQVLALRYGLGDGRCKSLEEVGRLFHVTKEWIRKIEKAALTKVRKEEVQSSLNYYLEL